MRCPFFPYLKVASYFLRYRVVRGFWPFYYAHQLIVAKQLLPRVLPIRTKALILHPANLCREVSFYKYRVPCRTETNTQHASLFYPAAVRAWWTGPRSDHLVSRSRTGELQCSTGTRH